MDKFCYNTKCRHHIHYKYGNDLIFYIEDNVRKEVRRHQLIMRDMKTRQYFCDVCWTALNMVFDFDTIKIEEEKQKEDLDFFLKNKPLELT